VNIRGYRLDLYQDDEDGSWVAEVPDLPGCLAAGDSPNEAVELAEDAIEAWIDAAQSEGRPVPPPSVVETQYSGRFVLRTPKSLHRRLAERAKSEGVSLNTLCITTLSAAVGAPEIVGQAAVASHAIDYWTSRLTHFSLTGDRLQGVAEARRDYTTQRGPTLLFSDDPEELHVVAVGHSR
jgi:antitoxin HicB